MLCLYRVAQEALQNALKYSRATELALNLSGTSDGLTLTIRDNGVGFDVDRAWGAGIGLRSVSERLQAVGGSLDLTSEPGAGTRLVAFVPWHTQSDPHSQPPAIGTGETAGTNG
jgi:signal transduction histidine kinase